MVFTADITVCVFYFSCLRVVGGGCRAISGMISGISDFVLSCLNGEYFLFWDSFGDENLEFFT